MNKTRQSAIACVGGPGAATSFAGCSLTGGASGSFPGGPARRLQRGWRLGFSFPISLPRSQVLPLHPSGRRSLGACPSAAPSRRGGGLRAGFAVAGGGGGASRPPWSAWRRSLLHSSGAGRSALPGTGGAPTYSARPLRRQRGHGNAATASRDRAARCPVPLAREGLLIRMSARPGKRSAIPRRQKCSPAGGRFLRHPRDSTSRAVDRNRPAGPS